MTDHRASGSAQSKVLIENEKLRATEWRFPALGDNTGWHRHEHDYLVIPMRNGALEIENEDGQRTRTELVTGAPYFRERGVEHDVINGNDFEYVFIEVELLAP